MRKAISLLLALSMVLVLCACGSESISAKQNDFAVEDFEIESSDSNRIYFKVKVRNNTDTDVDIFSINYQLLDENGDSIYSSSFGAPNLLAGQSSWLGKYGIEKEDCKGAVAIRFISYDTHKDKLAGRFNQQAEFSLTSTSSSSDAVDNEYFSLDAFCVDDSFQSSTSDSLRQVYLFFTVSAKEENLEVDSRYMYLKINDTNEYESVITTTNKRLFQSYYHSQHIEDLYLGDSIKILTIFQIPEADLAAGRSVALRDSQIPEIGEIKFSTDILQHFDSPEAMAESIDPEGYEKLQYMREEADEETLEEVKSCIAYGREYFTSTQGFTFGLILYKDNTCKVKIYPISWEGTYSIRNGFIFCTADSDPDKTLEVPYEVKDGLVYMDLASCFGF